MSRVVPPPPTVPPLGVQITYYSQMDLTLAYALRTGTQVRLPRFMMDKEADRLEADRVGPAPLGGALKDGSPGAQS